MQNQKLVQSKNFVTRTDVMRFGKKNAKFKKPEKTAGETKEAAPAEIKETIIKAVKKF